MYKRKSKQFDKNMKRLLILIERGETLPPLTQYDLQCLEECIKKGYVSGIKTVRTADNSLSCYLSENIRVEKAGLDFYVQNQIGF